MDATGGIVNKFNRSSHIFLCEAVINTKYEKYQLFK